MASPMSSGRRQGGFTYLVALLLIAMAGLSVLGIAEAWSRAAQREKEAELRWIGNQFTQAIGLYYQRTPGALKRYPERLDDLLEDRRFAKPQRYLRQIYRDPLLGKPEWDLIVAPAGGVMGVRSRAPGESLGGGAYGDWRFVYEPVVVQESR